mgnify:CR=1 FL=1
MSDVQALLARCRELGAELTPTPHGTLKVKAPAPLPDSLRDELKQRKAEILALLTSQIPAATDRPDPTPGPAFETVIFWPDSRKIDPANPPAPYLNERGELIVPFECAPRFRWWSGGQSIHATLLELGAPLDVIARYVDSETSLKRMQ